MRSLATDKGINQSGRDRGGLQTRRRILDAALRLFSRDGFQGASVRGLAREAGLTEAALYYYFRSKREILLALYEERGFVAALDLLEQLPLAKLPLAEQLRRTAIASAGLWHENVDLLRVVLMEVLRGDKAARSVHQALMDRWRQGILHLLARYQEEGQLPAQVDLAALANAWVHLLFGAFVDRLLAITSDGRRRSSFLTPEFREYLQKAVARFARQALT